MGSSNELLVNVIGLLVAFFGGFSRDYLVTIVGLASVLLSVILKLNDVETEIKDLNSQINTSREIDRMWRTMDRLKKNMKGRMDINSALLLIFIVAMIVLWLYQKGFLGMK